MELLEGGFKNWTRKCGWARLLVWRTWFGTCCMHFSLHPSRDFNAFIKACEQHGRDNIKAIAASLEGKTYEEVAAYSKVS